MTRYVITADVAIRLAQDETSIPDEHQLLAPTVLRSQTLSILHSSVMRGETSEDEAQAVLARLAKLPIRQSGDRVLRRAAWKVADQLGWYETFTAEYVALAQLQADALITLDAGLATAVSELVRTAPIEELSSAS
jgi:predicted nucleic acid-binding protein